MDDDIQELDISFLDGELNGLGSDDGSHSNETSEESEPEEEEEAVEVLIGPQQWQDVDTVELDRVMLRVTAAAMPSTDNKEMGTRLAMQAAALEVDNLDLLGLGRIDTQQLTLVRSDAAKKAWKTGAMGTSRRRGRRTDAEQNAAAAAESANRLRRQTLVNSDNVAELRSKALPSSESFDPEVYLGAIHANSTVPDLVKGSHHLRREASERTDQLKDLVKENFDRFISCKNTIDDIHKRLRKSEAHDSLSASGTSTSDMVIAISEVQDEAKRAFANLLSRASSSDQVKSVVALLKRYEGLFQLPSRIRQSTARGEYDQVISEYRKARSLMDSMGAPNTRSIWHKLFTEVEKVVSELVGRLESKLKDPETPQLVAIDAMRLILQLQADRAASTHGMEPVSLYVQARNQHLLRQIDECMERHVAHLQLTRTRDDITGPAWVPPISAQHEEITGRFRNAAASPWNCRSHSGSWLNLVKDLVSTVANSLPDFWHVPQDKLNQLKAVPGALKVVLAAVEDGLAMAQAILKSFSMKVSMALRELINEEGDRAQFLSAVREIVAAFISFNTTSTPQFVNDTLQSLLEHATSLAIKQMSAQLKSLTSRMAELEDFEIIALSHKAGHPASKLPGLLRELISSSMQRLEAVMKEGCKADSNTYAFNPLGENAPALRHAFFNCFTEYAVATDQLWAAVSAGTGPPSRSGPSRDAKLLVLHSNCVYVRTQILRELAGRYCDLLTNDGVMREASELQAESAEDIQAVEVRLAGIYIEARVDLLGDILEEYFDDDGTDWPNAPLPTGLRDAAFEIINTLVAVQAEVYSNNLSLQRRVMEELLQHLFSNYSTSLNEKLPSLNAGGTLQLLIELQFFGRGLGLALRGARSELLEQAKSALLARIDELAESGDAEAEKQLDEWCETIQGGSMGGRAEMVSGFVAGDIVKAARLNVASFKA